MEGLQVRPCCDGAPRRRDVASRAGQVQARTHVDRVRQLRQGAVQAPQGLQRHQGYQVREGVRQGRERLQRSHEAHQRARRHRLAEGHDQATQAAFKGRANCCPQAGAACGEKAEERQREQLRQHLSGRCNG